MYFTSTDDNDNMLYTKQIDETVNFLLKTVNDFVLLNLKTDNKKDYSLDEVNTIIDKLTYYYKSFNNLLPINNSSEYSIILTPIYYLLNRYTEMIENFANSLTED